MMISCRSSLWTWLGAALLMLVLGAGPLSAQDPAEEDLPLTEQELIEMETGIDPELDVVPPDIPEESVVPPDAPIAPVTPRRPYLAPRPAPRLDPALEPPVPVNELVPGTIEITEVRNVSFFDGEISVDFRNVPAGEALEEIGRLAGFKVVTDEAFKKKALSIRFSKQPLEKGLTRIIRLLEAGNYRYFYTEQGTLESVVVTGTAQPVATQPAQGTPAASRPRTITRTPTGSRRPTVDRTPNNPAQNTPRVTRRPNLIQRPTVTP